MRLLPLLLATLVACSSPSARGTLVDGLTGKPIPEMRLIATAASSTSMSCSAFEATTDASGAFLFDALCSGTAYTVKPANENIWLADGDQIPDGGAADLKLTGWLAPKGDGMFRLSNGELNAINTSADIKSEPIWNSDTLVARYPATLPKVPVLVGPDDYLVLVGETYMNQTKYHPLIPSGERKFGSQKDKIISMFPWSYIGIEFTSDTEFTEKTASADASKIVTRTRDGRSTAWVKGDALPPGRYAVHKENDTRTTVLDFGKAPE